MNIETEYIKSLLSKYYSGESTLDEERLIREYFAGDATDPELETDRMVFAAMAETVKAPESLREAVEKHVEQESAKEIKKRLRPRYGRIAAAAAVLPVPRRGPRPASPPAGLRRSALTAAA